MTTRRKREMFCERVRTVLLSWILLMSVLFFLGPGLSPDARALTWTQTTLSDFENATVKWNVDTTSDPGNVSLVPSPTDWIKAESEKLSLVATLPSPRFYSPAIWDGSSAYIFGGEDGVPTNLDQIVKYNPTTKAATIMSSTLPTPGGQMSAVWDGDHVYLFGGTVQGGGGPRDQILGYDPLLDTLSVMAEVLPSRRYSTAAVWNGSTALVFGGTDNSVVFDDILSYDPSLDALSVLPAKLPGPRYDSSAIWDGSSVFIFGGHNPPFFLDEIVKYDPATDSISLMNARLPSGLAQTSAVFDGNYVYIFGGQTSTGYTDQVLRYDPSTDTIRTLSVTFPSQRLATSAVWTGSKALVFGGYSPSLDDIIEYTPGINPVLTEGPQGSWDDYAIGAPSILKEDSVYRMWFQGVSELTTWRWSVGHAESDDGLKWTKGTTPVFEPDPSSTWDHYGVDRPVVLKVAGTYKMWYSGYTDSSGLANRIGLAESPDGINWTRVGSTPVLGPGNPGEWDDTAIWKTSVMFEDGTYRMWFTGHDGINCQSSIGYAESADGRNWTRYGNNPVLDSGPKGSWDDVGIEVSHVEKIDDQYVMWYNRHCPTEALGVATSPDGVTWIKHALNPVLEKSAPGSWDDKGVTWVTVLRESSALRMWYSGDSTAGNWRVRIGHATAAYASRFNKAPSNPVLDTGFGDSWDKDEITGPSVLKVNDEYMMWYRGRKGSTLQIGLAESVDGKDWIKNPESPVMTQRPGDWDQIVGSPCVSHSNGLFEMWYMGSTGVPGAWKIGYANSTDGIHWDRYGGNPVFDVGSPGSWDDYEVLHPFVMRDKVSGTYKMWYTGYDGDTGYKIGYAESVDGLNWTRGPSNPVLSVSPGTWEERHVGQPSVIQENGVYKMWYFGQDSSDRECIGYAMSYDGKTWTKSLLNPMLNPGPPGLWDSRKVSHPSVVRVDNEYVLWFGGRDPGPPYDWRIGMATSEYMSTGLLESEVFDSGFEGTTWNMISWDEYLPPNTDITIAVRAGNTSQPDSTWTSWSSEFRNESGTTLSLPRTRYMQYRATLISMDAKYTPILSEVDVVYTCAGAGPLDILLRIAGEKWHDVTFTIYEDGAEIFNETLLRLPGSPNEQMIGPENFQPNPSSSYSAIVRYTPEDDRVNGQKWGATPAWIILRAGGEEIARLHHTFNAKHPETWEWRVDDLNSHFPALSCDFTPQDSDTGSDDTCIVEAKEVARQQDGSGRTTGLLQRPVLLPM